MLALASLLILSSCGQTAGVKTAGAQQTTGEIVASSETYRNYFLCRQNY